MSTFQYHGFAAGGVRRRGLVEALDLKEAREKLLRDGVYVERIAEASAAASGRGGRALLDTAARAQLYRELAAMLRSGLSLAQALDLAIVSRGASPAAARLAGVRDRIREGATLPAALRAAAPQASELEVALLVAGERVGAMDASLDRLAGYLESQLKLRERLTTALFYPLLVLAVAALIGVVLTGVVIPRAEALFAENRIPMPRASRVIFVATRAAAAVGWPACLAAAVLGVLAWRRARGREESRERIDGLRLRVPVVGTAARLAACGRFARTLGMLNRGGVPLVEAVALAGSATGNARVAARARAAAEALRQGEPLSAAVGRIPELGGELAGWIRAGDASGRVTDLLEVAADRFEDRSAQYLERAATLAGPLMILLVGGYVLMVAVAVLLPILSLNQALR